MAKAGITGRWRGTLDYAGRAIHFKLVLGPSRLGYFKGEVEQDPVDGIPEKGQVRGHIRGMKVAFRKLFASLYLEVHGRYVAYYEQFFRENGRMPAQKLRHPPMHFEGRMNDDRTEMSGHWKLTYRGQATQGGEWTAQRVV